MSPLVRLAPLFRPDLGLLALCTALSAVATALVILAPYVMAQAIDRAIVGADLPLLYGYAACYAAIVVCQLAAQYASRVGIERVAQGAMFRLKERLFDHLVAHDQAFHDVHSSGRLITRVQGDTSALQVLFAEVVLAFPADVALAIGMIGMLAAQSPWVAVLVAGVLPLWGVSLALFRRWSPPLFLAEREVRARLSGFLAEHVRAMPMLRHHGRHDWVRERAAGLNAEVQRREVAEGLASVALFNVLFAIRSVGFAAVLWGGGLLVLNGEVTVGVLVMALGYLRQLFGPLMRLSHNLSTAERARAAAIRIAEILDTPITVTSPAAPRVWPGGGASLRLEGVRFRYGPELPVVLDGVSLEVRAGERVGIVGATGSGKSTIVQLLLRFRDPVAGRVSVDGVDVRELQIAELRAKIGYVAQDVRLFVGTVRDNLGAKDDAARRALAEVGLELSLDHPIARDGANLSRGERQLLTFARALARDPAILLLDEATSAVDPETEGRVQAAVARVLAGRTAVIVAHRLSTVQDCDRIVVLDAGRIVEEGTHDALLARGGAYAGLWALQAGEESLAQGVAK